MARYSTPALLTLALGALLWAYIIINDLLPVFGANVSLIDLLTILVMGLIAGLGFGLAAALRRWCGEAG